MVGDTRSPQAPAPVAGEEKGPGRGRAGPLTVSSHHILPSCAGGHAGGQSREGCL